MKFSNFFLIIETHLGHPYDSWTTVKYVHTVLVCGGSRF